MTEKIAIDETIFAAMAMNYCEKYIVRDYSPEIFEYPFIIKTGDDTAAFENYIMGIFSKFGKTLLIK